MKCSVEDCQGTAVAKGICDKHYRRIRRNNSLEQTRPSDWGEREKHKLYSSWTYMKRRYGFPFVAEWHDFWTFVNDVVSRPSEDHRLARKDDSLPIGPSNFFWRKNVVKKRSGESPSEYASRYQREWRKANDMKHRGYELKRRFGIEFGRYEEIHELQNGVCAICKKPETAIIRGKVLELAVDHCHETGKIRGLLCTKCNQGLGKFLDSPNLLMEAALYLESHGRTM